MVDIPRCFYFVCLKVKVRNCFFREIKDMISTWRVLKPKLDDKNLMDHAQLQRKMYEQAAAILSREEVRIFSMKKLFCSFFFKKKFVFCPLIPSTSNKLYVYSSLKHYCFRRNLTMTCLHLSTINWYPTWTFWDTYERDRTLRYIFEACSISLISSFFD